MKRQDFFYTLPDELIARYPAEKRSASRLLQMDRSSGAVKHGQFRDFPSLLKPNDLLVFNNTKVIPARLYATKETGGKVEILVERLLDEKRCLAHIKSSKSPKAEARLFVDEDNSFCVTGREGALFCLQYEQDRPLLALLESQGHMPLPPYIDRDDELSDRERYQTLYGTVPGAVAAPTAGLHFDEETFATIQALGVETAFVTLHVGAGTFQPVRVDDVKSHVMHYERFEVDEVLCEKIQQTRACGGRVVAVGTTTVRCLESAFKDKVVQPINGDTNIFIYPGYQFKVVDALLTNFHLPESTLMMLISAFSGEGDSGRQHVLSAYQQAIEERYRFFSYGDAMFIA